ncbi:MAG: hypothetical protein NXI31_20995 [bacterium]|nr:hypothetical protein [bacterium]
MPELTAVTTEAGSPGRVSFQAAKDFDYRKALDAVVADGVGALKGYKVLE